MKALFFLLTILLFGQGAWAQNAPMDSIRLQVSRHPELDTLRVLSLNNLALAYMNYKPDSAFQLAQQGLVLAEKLGYTKGIAQSYTYMGIYQNNKDKYDLAIDYQLKALERNEKLGYTKGMADNFLSLGFIYQKLKDNTKALTYYEKALPMYQKLNDRINIARTTNNLGIIYKRLKILDKALEAYRESLRMKEAVGDVKGTASTLINIAEVLEIQGKFEEAIDYSLKSLKVSKEYGNQQVTAIALYSLASIYQQTEEYNQSLEYGLQALTLAQKNGFKSDAKDAALILSESHSLLKNYEKALEFYKYYTAVQDSIFSLEKSKAISTLQSTYDLEKKQKEVEILSKNQEILRIETERQRNARLAVQKQAEADRLFALAQQEKDRRKQDSLQNLAQKAQLEADNLRVREEKLKAENRARELEILKEKEAKELQQIINYLIGISLIGSTTLALVVWRNRKKIQKAYQKLSLANEDILQKNEEIHQQKEEILQTLQTVNEQNGIIEKKNHDMTASIVYARRIQNALLPKKQNIRDYIPHFLLFYQPKDIVSGDFYWFSSVSSNQLSRNSEKLITDHCLTENCILALADCTGHGVPGAFMTVIGNNLLDQVINKDSVFAPAQILSELDKLLLKTLKQNSETQIINDGMDISILKLEKTVDSNSPEKAIFEKLVWASAKRPLWIFEHGKTQLTEYKGSRFPIGSSQFEEKIFTEQEIFLQKGDLIYSFTDGYADQFGEKGKFTIRRFRNLLQEIHTEDFGKQEDFLAQNLQTWKGAEKQTDDVLVVGILV